MRNKHVALIRQPTLHGVRCTF